VDPPGPFVGRKSATSDCLGISGEQNPKMLAEALNCLAGRVEMNSDEEKSSLKRWHKTGLLHLHRKAVPAVHPTIRDYVNKYAVIKGGPRILGIKPAGELRHGFASPSFEHLGSSQV
jgi:hypothetical protein